MSGNNARFFRYILLTRDCVTQEIAEAKRIGAEVVELRLDFQEDLDLQNPGPQIQEQLSACKQAGMPAIITLRPQWEG